MTTRPRYLDDPVLNLEVHRLFDLLDDYRRTDETFDRRYASGLLSPLDILQALAAKGVTAP